MLGSIGSSFGSGGVESFYPRPGTVVPKKPKKQSLDQLIEQEWSELPYAMMRITAARRPWDGKRVYWRDQSVQLDDLDLNLIRVRSRRNGTSYRATYKREDIHRDFPLQPSFEDDQLRWSAPGISEAQLTTEQLAEKLLARLVTFYTTGLA